MSKELVFPRPPRNRGVRNSEEVSSRMTSSGGKRIRPARTPRPRINPNTRARKIVTRVLALAMCQSAVVDIGPRRRRFLTQRRLSKTSRTTITAIQTRSRRASRRIASSRDWLACRSASGSLWPEPVRSTHEHPPPRGMFISGTTLIL